MTTKEMPEPLATVAKLRAEGRPEAEIAAALGVSKHRLWGMVSNWNAAHPEQPVPRPLSRPKIPRVEQAASLALAGQTPAEIAQALGCTRHRAVRLLYTARGQGLIPGTQPSTRTLYTRLRAKGAAPRIGNVMDIVAALSHDQMRQMLAAIARTDTTLAQTLARLVAEALDARKE